MANRRPTKQKDIVDWVNDKKAAAVLAQGHPKSAPVTAIATPPSTGAKKGKD
jgi:hypothetical protein